MSGISKFGLIGFAIVLIACSSQPEALPTEYVIPTLTPVSEQNGLAQTTTFPITWTPEATDGAVDVDALVTETPDAERQAQIDYLDERGDVVSAAQTVKNNIDPTVGLYIEGKVSGDDPAWQATVETLFDEFDKYVDAHRALEVPGLFTEGHAETQEGLDNCSLGFRTLMDGVKQVDDELYQSGVPLINTCNQKWSNGDRIIEEARISADLPSREDTLGPVASSGICAGEDLDTLHDPFYSISVDVLASAIAIDTMGECRQQSLGDSTSILSPPADMQETINIIQGSIVKSKATDILSCAEPYKQAAINLHEAALAVAQARQQCDPIDNSLQTLATAIDEYVKVTGEVEGQVPGLNTAFDDLNDILQ